MTAPTPKIARPRSGQRCFANYVVNLIGMDPFAYSVEISRSLASV